MNARSFQQPPDGKKKEKRIKRRLNPGQIVKSTHFEWTVAEILGSGGFGDVYKVSGQKEEGAYAMKTEYKDPQKRKSKDRLKLETEILAVFTAETDPERTKHFLKMIDKGMTESFKFIVMTLVSHSLDDIREHTETMTWATITHIALQTLKAIEDLHGYGYLHRDIKPHNFAIGLPPKEATIFMIDFGIARRYVEKDDRRKIRIPRQSVSFLGTTRWASRNCHNDKEQSRRDDLESWCYLVIYFFHPDNLTWKRETNKTRVCSLKHQLMTREDRKINTPKAMNTIIDYVKDMTYMDAPDYEKIREWLHDGAKEDNLDLARKLDWIDIDVKKLGNKRKGPLAANRITDDEDDTTPSKKKKKEERRKRFSQEIDSSSSDEVPIVRKAPPTRRTVASASKMALAIAPSAKGGRTRRSVLATAPHPTGDLPPPSALRMPQGGGGGPMPARDQTAMASSHPDGTAHGGAPTKSNYTTAIPRTPSRETFNSPSSKKKKEG